MGLEKKLGTVITALALAGANSLYAQQRVLVPYEDLRLQGSGTEITLPDIRADDDRVMRYRSITPSLVRQYSQGRNDYDFVCGNGYKLVDGQVTFPDGSFCDLELCKERGPRFFSFLRGNQQQTITDDDGGDGGGSQDSPRNGSPNRGADSQTTSSQTTN